MNTPHPPILLMISKKEVSHHVVDSNINQHNDNSTVFPFGQQAAAVSSLSATTPPLTSIPSATMHYHLLLHPATPASQKRRTSHRL